MTSDNVKKQCVVLIKTGEEKFIPIGTAEIELIFAFKDRDYVLDESKLNRININVKEGDTIWKENPDLWRDKK